jgi:hypothetical protein
MMSDRMIDEIRRVINYSKDTDDASVWSEYLGYYQDLPAFNRKAILTFVDEEHFAHFPEVTKDAARMLQRKRQLDDINEILLRAGK